jgi:hypothetical protein
MSWSKSENENGSNNPRTVATLKAYDEYVSGCYGATPTGVALKKIAGITPGFEADRVASTSGGTDAVSRLDGALQSFYMGTNVNEVKRNPNGSLSKVTTPQTYTLAERNMARYSAVAMIDPKATLLNLSVGAEGAKPELSIADSGNVTNIDYNLYDKMYASGALAGLENFDSASADGSALAKLSFLVGVNSANGFNEFDRALYPSIAIEALSPGFQYTIRYPAILDANARQNINGSVMSPLIDNALIPKLYKPGLYDTEVTKVVPNYIVGVNDKEFIGACSYVTSANGAPTTTAPLALNVKTSLIGLSIPDSELTSGSPSLSRTLSPAISLQRVYFKLTGANSAVEYLFDDVSGKGGGDFVEATGTTVDTKDMRLSFKDQVFVINTSKTTKHTGEKSAILAALPAGYVIQIGYGLSGDINTASGTQMYSPFGNLEILSVTNPAGDVIVSSSAEFISIADALSVNLSLAGCTLNANYSNLDLSGIGRLIRMTSFSRRYGVNTRTGLALIEAVFDNNGPDADLIDSLSAQNGMQMHSEAVEHLLFTVNKMKAAKTNGEAAFQTAFNTPVSPHRPFYNPYFETGTLDLGAAVNTLRSSEKMVDMRAALVNSIRPAITNMLINSGFMIAHQQIHGENQPIRLTIAIHSSLAMLLELGHDDIAISDNVIVNVVSTLYDTMRDTVVIVPSATTVETSGEPSITNWGVRLVCPPLIIPVGQRTGMTTKTSVVKTAQNIQRFSHYVTAPVMHLIELTGVNEALAQKTVFNTHNV